MGELAAEEPSGGTLDVVGGISGAFGIWESSGRHLGNIREASGRHLGSIWVASGIGDLGSIWAGHLGSGRHLGGIWKHLEASGKHLEGIGKHLGNLEAS